MHDSPEPRRRTSDAPPGAVDDPDRAVSIVVELLTAAGHPVPVLALWDVADLTGPANDESPAEVLERAERLRLVHTDRSGLVTVDPVVAESVRQRLGGMRLSALRAELGRILLDRPAVDQLVVTHHRLAGLAAQPDEVVIPAVLADAEWRVHRGDLGGAIDRYSSVLEALDAGARPADRRVDALVGLAHALIWARRRAEAAQVIADAVAEARRTREPTHLAAAALAWTAGDIPVDDDPAATMLVDDALAELGDDGDPVLRARLLAQRAERQLFTDLEAAQRDAAAALELAISTGDAPTQALAAYSRRVVIWHPSTHDEVLRLAAIMQRAAPRAPGQAEYGAITRLQVFLEQGDAEHFDAELRGLGVRLEVEGNPIDRLWERTFAGARALRRGEWHDVDRIAAESQAIAADMDYRVASQLLLAQQMLAAWHQGVDLSSLVTTDALPPGPLRRSWAASLLGLSAHHLPPRRVAEGLDEFLGEGMTLRPDLTWGPTAACLSMAVVHARSVDHARRLAPMLEPVADRWAATGGAVSFGPLALHLGRLHELLDRPDDALTQFRAAALACIRNDAPVWAEAVERAMQLHGASAGDASGLSTREFEVLTLVAEGCTNRQVAERLFLSVKTVERHLLNAYTKIGVRNRAEATAWVLRRELG